jgi:alpha-aminoadipate carrier protein LysW
MVKCPLCDGAIDVEEDDLDEGDELVCEECGAELRVAGVDPLELEDVGDEEDEEEADFDEDGEDERWR